MSSNNTQKKIAFKLIYPYWTKKDNNTLVNLITKYKIQLSENYEHMLTTALATNFLADPENEYEILMRIWALALIEKGFFSFNQGLIDT